MLEFLKKMTKKIETKGFEKLTYSNSTLFMSNHISLNDIPLLDTVLPKDVIFAINKENKNDYNDIYKTRPSIFYDVFDLKTILDIKTLLLEGKSVLIFPETKISTTSSFMKIYPEIAKMAFDSKATIYPIIINGSIDTPFIPTTSITVALGDAFTLNENDGSFDYQILRKLQSLLLEIKLKKDVNLYNELVDCSKIYGEKTVIVQDMEQKMTYRDFILATHVFSYKLSELLTNDKTVGTFLPTSIGYTLTLFTLFKLGKTSANLNFTMGEQNLLDCLETANVKTIITSKKFIEKGNFEHVIETLRTVATIIYLEDVKTSITKKDKIKALSDYTVGKKSDSNVNELILFTSGSEAKPKGVILTHQNIYSNIHQALSVIDFTTQDKILNAMPMFHSFGLTAGAILPFLSGIPAFLYPAPTHYKAIPELAYRNDATIIFGTSTFFSMYGKNAHPYDFNKVRFAIAGAEKLKPDVFELWTEKFGIRILEGYGVTETSPIISLNTPLSHKKGSVGRIIPGMVFKIEPVEGIDLGGNLLVKGPNIMKGYLIHNKGFVPKSEWYDTGDIAKVDEEGYISIISRLKRFSKIGGEMVPLNFVEELAFKTYGTNELATVAIPDKRKGERIILFVKNKDFHLKELKRYIKERKHSSLLIPREIQVIEEIPLLGSGKTDYVKLKQIAEKIYS